MAQIWINWKLRSAKCGRIITSWFSSRPAIRPFILCSTLAMVLSNPAISQVEVAPATSAVFSDSIKVELINVDVFVTDRNGNPIADLKVEDFEVFEDGEPVAISHFAFLGSAADTVQKKDSSLQPSSAELSAENNHSLAAAPETSLPHLVIAFDSRHLTQTAKRRTMKGLREYIGGTSIPPNQIMIMNLGHSQNHGFDVMVPFGSTREDLEEGLQHIKKIAPGGRRVTIEYQRLMAGLKESHMEYRRRDPYAVPAQICGQVKEQWRASIRSYSKQTSVRVTDTVLRLIPLMKVFSGVPGHKAFLYIGGGLELVPGEDVYAYANRICPNMFNPLDGQGDSRAAILRQLTEAANTYRISFNAFEASRFNLSMIVSAEDRYALYTPGTNVQKIRTANLQNSLVMLASETGGKAILNRDGGFPDLEDLDEALCSYYSLGYAPPHPGEKGIHNIKIKLKSREGLQLRYRRDYSERPVAERQEDKLLSVLALGWSHNPLDIRLEHGDSKSIDGQADLFLVPISITVPVADLVCVPGQENDSTCRVRLLMRVSDEKDRVSPLFEKLVDIRLKKNAVPQEEVTLSLTNKMRRGNHRLVLGVMDDMGLTASYLVHPVSVGNL